MRVSPIEQRAKELGMAVKAISGGQFTKKEREKPFTFVTRVEGGTRGEKGEPGVSPIVDHEDIYNKVLERLKKEKSLVISDLKDGQAFVFNNTKYGTHEMMHGGGSSSGSFADGETPAGTINSSNKIFTLAHVPSPASSLQLYLNGALQQSAGGDYTLSSLTITFNSAPLTGSILLAWYRY